MPAWPFNCWSDYAIECRCTACYSPEHEFLVECDDVKLLTLLHYSFYTAILDQDSFSIVQAKLQESRNQYHLPGDSIQMD